MIVTQHDARGQWRRNVFGVTPVMRRVSPLGRVSFALATRIDVIDRGLWWRPIIATVHVPTSFALFRLPELREDEVCGLVTHGRRLDDGQVALDVTFDGNVSRYVGRGAESDRILSMVSRRNVPVLLVVDPAPRAHAVLGVRYDEPVLLARAERASAAAAAASGNDGGSESESESESD